MAQDKFKPVYLGPEKETLKPDSTREDTIIDYFNTLSNLNTLGIGNSMQERGEIEVDAERYALWDEHRFDVFKDITTKQIRGEELSEEESLVMDPNFAGDYGDSFDEQSLSEYKDQLLAEWKDNEPNLYVKYLSYLSPPSEMTPAGPSPRISDKTLFN